jgi:ABC-2 type transport system permease protein
VILFLSSAFFPEDLLTSPVDVIARYNPLSYVANGIRSPIIGAGDTETVLLGYASAIGILVVFGALAVRALHGRIGDR